MSSSSLSLVTPPENFSMVHNGIFRSDFPRDDNFSFLNSLGLRSIIFFRPKTFSIKALARLKAYNTERFQFELDDGKEPFEEKIRGALRVVVDVTKHPVLIICPLEFAQHKHKHSAGYLVGCFRRLQQWCLASVFNEFQRFAAANVGESDEKVIEFFDLSSFRQSPSFHSEGLESLLSPTLNFSMVHNGIFRSDYPSDDNIGFLKSLGLRSIIRFRDTANVPSIRPTCWLNACNLELFQFVLNDGKEPFEEKIRRALRVVVDVTKHPVLIDCTQEFAQHKHSAGYLVGCFRRLQQWCLPSVYKEFRRFAAAKVGESDEKFIESFDLSSFR